MTGKTTRWAVIAALLVGAAGCCGSGGSSSNSTSTDNPAAPATPSPTGGAAAPGAATPTPTPPPPVKVVSATFAKGLSDNQSAVNPTKSFLPMEKMCLSIELAGRPRSGKVEATWMWRDKTLGRAAIDVATVNKGVIWSAGQSTMIGFNFTPAKSLWPGNRYHAEVTFNGQQLGSFPFSITQPPGATPSKLVRATLAKGATKAFQPIEPGNNFGRLETVHIVGAVDLGQLSWVQVDWLVNGVNYTKAQQSFNAAKNLQDFGVGFYCMPDGGWPPGSHQAILTIDDNEVGRYPFTVTP